MVERAYRFRFYPTSEQENLLRRTLGCVRLVYNLALATRTKAWYERQERIGYPETSSLLTSWKKESELDFLNEVSCVPLQQGLRHLQKAFGNFWAKRAKYPRFKKKRNGGSAEFTKSAFKWRDGQLWLAKSVAPLNIVWSRFLPQDTEPSTVTVRLDPSGRWFVSLLVDDQMVKPLPRSQSKVGLDAGITSLVTTSAGEKVNNPKQFNRNFYKLRQAQKTLSRRVKGSYNYYKAALEVAKIYASIKDARTDFLHKLTTRLISENQVIAVEDLGVRNMVKNRKLARSISDAGWGELVRQLTYKAAWYGRELIKIDRWFPSSKRCGSCGHVVDKLPAPVVSRRRTAVKFGALNVREWTCQCGTTHDRDINAAQNILAAGLAVSVCGDGVRLDGHSSKKQPRKTRKGRKQKLK